MTHGFKIGGRCVCVDYSFKFQTLPNPPIKKGGVYDVIGVIQAPCCGSLLLDIGLKTSRTTMICSCCENIGSNPFGVGSWPLLASRFIPLQEEEFKQITFTKILETVPVGAQ